MDFTAKIEQVLKKDDEGQTNLTKNHFSKGFEPLFIVEDDEERQEFERNERLCRVGSSSSEGSTDSGHKIIGFFFHDFATAECFRLVES